MFSHLPPSPAPPSLTRLPPPRVAVSKPPSVEQPAPTHIQGGRAAAGNGQHHRALDRLPTLASSPDPYPAMARPPSSSDLLLVAAAGSTLPTSRSAAALPCLTALRQSRGWALQSAASPPTATPLPCDGTERRRPPCASPRWLFLTSRQICPTFPLPP
ncbi:hypothetical protein VPH35_138327 [Triticum aestivum]